MFDRFWKDWDRIFEELNRDFEKMFKQSVNELSKNPDQARTWGFKMYWDNSLEKPVFRYFGNVDPTTGKMLQEGWRVPSTEKIYDENTKTWKIITELPGVKKGEIELTTTKKYLNLETTSKEHMYKQKIDFETEIESDSVKAKFNNGILEISVKSKIPPPPDVKKVSIE